MEATEVIEGNILIDTFLTGRTYQSAEKYFVVMLLITTFAALFTYSYATNSIIQNKPALQLSFGNMLNNTARAFLFMRYKTLFDWGYTLDRKGVVRNKKGKRLKLHTGGSGYFQINAHNKGKTKTFSLHRAIAIKYIPNPKNLPEVNHKNGIKTDNRISNLEWVTRSENMRHGIKMGLIPATWLGKSGKLHHRSKPVKCMSLSGRLIKTYGSAREAAKKSKVSYGTISNVLIGRGVTAGGFKWEYSLSKKSQWHNSLTENKAKV